MELHIIKKVTTTNFCIGLFSDQKLLTSNKWKPFLERVQDFMNSQGQGKKLIVANQSLILFIDQQENVETITPEKVLQKVQELYDEYFGTSPE